MCHLYFILSFYVSLPVHVLSNTAIILHTFYYSHTMKDKGTLWIFLVNSVKVFLTIALCIFLRLNILCLLITFFNTLTLNIVPAFCWWVATFLGTLLPSYGDVIHLAFN